MTMNTAEMLIFDTLAYAKKLKAAGFTDEQAEVQSEALAGVLESNMPTKHDINKLEQKIKVLNYKLTIRLGGMLVVAVGLLASLEIFSR